jgi:adenylate cyclase
VNPKNFFAELKRRNVYKVAIAYAIVAWLLMQIATQVFPFLEIPNWAIRLVIMLIVIGFPIALVIAWTFELTPEGLKRTEDVDLDKSIRRKTGRKLDFFIIAVLLLTAIRTHMKGMCGEMRRRLSQMETISSFQRRISRWRMV